MGIRPDIQERARSIIARDIESIALLQQLLAEEQQALATRDLSAINTAVHKKLECLKALDALERERKALTAQSGLREWNRLLTAADPSLLVEWKGLAVKLRELAETTATTEKIVSTSPGCNRMFCAGSRSRMALPRLSGTSVVRRSLGSRRSTTA